MIVFVFLGLAMAVCATVGMTWPSDVPGEPFVRLVAHWDRLLAVPPEGVEAAPLAGLEALAWTWRRVWDALHYVLLLAGIGLAVWALLRDGPAPWVGLMVVGALGFFYAAGMALYNGPLIAMPGYLLVLFGALLTALTWRRARFTVGDAEIAEASEY